MKSNICPRTDFAFDFLVQIALKLVLKVLFCGLKIVCISRVQAMIKEWGNTFKGGARQSSAEHLRQQIVLVLQSSNVPILSHSTEIGIFIARHM